MTKAFAGSWGRINDQQGDKVDWAPLTLHELFLIPNNLLKSLLHADLMHSSEFGELASHFLGHSLYLINGATA